MKTGKENKNIKTVGWWATNKNSKVIKKKMEKFIIFPFKLETQMTMVVH